MGQELVEMSRKELDRLAVVRQVLEGRLTQAKAGEFVGLSGAPGAPVVRGVRGSRAGGPRLGQARPAQQSALARRAALAGNRDRARSLRRLWPHVGARKAPRAARSASVQGNTSDLADRRRRLG